MYELNVGGHLSLGRNPVETVRWAHENGFGGMQIFASSPGAWKPPIVDEAVAASFVAARERYEVKPLVIHAIYLINLASADPTLAHRSQGSLIATLRAGRAIGACGVVTHIGSHGGRGYEAVADQVAAALRTVLESAEDGIDLMLENSAGAGGILGADLAEIGDLIRRAGEHPRLKVTIDTAHLTGAGWDLTRPEEVERLIRTLDNEIGLERLAVIHANDSAQPVGSRKDRHANIGEGHVGMEGFRNLLAQPALRRVPWILETPDLEARVDDLAKLRSLLPDPAVAGSSHAS